MTLLWLATAWLAGTTTATFGWSAAWPLAAVSVGALGSLLRSPSPRCLLLGCAALLFTAVGFVHAARAQPSPAPEGIARLNDTGPVRFRGLVSDEPQRRETTLQAKVTVRQVFLRGAWQAGTGRVLITRGHYPALHYGDLVELEGVPETPRAFGGFDYPSYLARQGIHSVVYYPRVAVLAQGQGTSWRAWLFAWRARLIRALDRALPEPQASLASGILLGSQSRFSSQLQESFNRTGTAHIVAVSGANLTIFTGLLCALLAPLIGRRRTVLVVAPMLLIYTLLIGAPVSAVRAAIMALLYLGAVWSGRPTTGLLSLILAAALMTAFNPLLPRDISFQLSVAATAGLLTYGEVFWRVARHTLERVGGEALISSQLIRSLIQAATTTVAAILATEPLIAWHFGRLSLVALPTNLIVVPLVGPAMGLSTLIALMGSLGIPFSDLLGWLAWPFLTAILSAIQLFAALPFASTSLHGVRPFHTVVFYLGSGGLIWGLARTWRARPLAARPVHALRLPEPGLPACVVLAALTAICWGTILFARPERRLAFTALDVGQGDALLIQTPSGQRILIDGGPSGDRLLRALGREIPFWDRRLDMIVLTHPQADHLNGLITVLDRYRVRQVLSGPEISAGPTVEAWRQALHRHRLTLHVAAPGEWLALSEDTTLRVLGPLGSLNSLNAKPNNAGLVLRLDSGTVSFLLTADIEQDAERALLEARVPLRATVLKVAHHGSSTSTTPQFIEAVRPSIAVISVGADNRFGHPSSQTLARLSRSLVLRTDQHGTIRLSTDGRDLWLEADRLPPH